MFLEAVNDANNLNNPQMQTVLQAILSYLGPKVQQVQTAVQKTNL